MKRLLAAFLAVVALAAVVPLATAAVPTHFVDQLVIDGLQEPMSLAFLPDGRVLYVEQYAQRIRQVLGGAGFTVVKVPNVRNGGESGLYAVAVDPGWPVRPYLYVLFNSTFNTAIVSRFTATGDLDGTGNGLITADTLTQYTLIADIPDTSDFHTGGTLRFGPDGMLYVSLGDDRTSCQAQDLHALLGKILRLDVGSLPPGPGGPAEKGDLVPADNPFAAASDENHRLVWALGLRNPFRFSIDPLLGDLYIGDVGEDAFEEVDQASVGGLNFGWPWVEGAAPGPGCPGLPPPESLSAPIYAYANDLFAPKAVVAGPLYRRNGGIAQFPEAYDGDLFCSDFFSDALVRLTRVAGQWEIAPPVPGQPADTAWATGFKRVSDIVRGPDGALWYCERGAFLTGKIRRIVYTGGPKLSINDVRRQEGNAGTTAFEFVVTLAYPPDEDVTVDFMTVDGIATVADEDYASTSGTATIPAKGESVTLTVPVNGDQTQELNEFFTILLFNPVGAAITDGVGEAVILNDDGMVAVGDAPSPPFALGVVAPNPSHGVTRIDFALPRASPIRLAVLDVQGREVALLAAGVHPAGRHEVAWTGRIAGRLAPAGIYFVRYQTPVKNFVRRVLFVR